MKTLFVTLLFLGLQARASQVLSESSPRIPLPHCHGTAEFAIELNQPEIKVQSKKCTLLVSDDGTTTPVDTRGTHLKRGETHLMTLQSADGSRADSFLVEIAP